MVTVGALSVYVLFAFFLLEYSTFFWVKRRYGAAWALVAAHVVAFVFGGALMLPLESLGVFALIPKPT